MDFTVMEVIAKRGGIHRNIIFRGGYNPAIRAAVRADRIILLRSTGKDSWLVRKVVNKNSKQIKIKVFNVMNLNGLLKRRFTVIDLSALNNYIKTMLDLYMIHLVALLEKCRNK